MTKVGAYEAKTHLAQLLERVEAGESIAITRHGIEVAHLIPPQGSAKPADLADLAARWKKTRQRVRLGNLTVRELIDKGRR